MEDIPYWDNYIPMPNTRNIERLNYLLFNNKKSKERMLGFRDMELHNSKLLYVKELILYLGEDLLSNCVLDDKTIRSSISLSWIDTNKSLESEFRLKMLVYEDTVQVYLMERDTVDPYIQYSPKINRFSIWGRSDKDFMMTIKDIVKNFNNGRHL